MKDLTPTDHDSPFCAGGRTLKGGDDKSMDVKPMDDKPMDKPMPDFKDKEPKEKVLYLSNTTVTRSL